MRIHDRTTFNRDLALINQIKAEKQELALQVLFNYYLPLTQQSIAAYKISFFDQADLLQEALLVCYFCALSFDEKQHFPFGVYFRRSLINRLISLTRYDKAEKRAYYKTCSLDQLIDLNSNFLKENDNYVANNISVDEVTQLKFCLTELNTILSPTECFVFHNFTLKRVSLNDFCHKYDISHSAVYGACRRCKNKLHRLLEDQIG